MITPCSHIDCENRTEFGYCKTTACINPMHSNLGTAQYGQGVQRNIITNADRLNAMSVEEKAEWLEENTTGCPPGLECYGPSANPTTQFCIKCWLNWLNKTASDTYWLDWLKQEVNNGD